MNPGSLSTALPVDDAARAAALAELRNVPPAEAPADFTAFWRRTRTEADAVPLNVITEPSPILVDGFDIFEVAFSSLGGCRVRGWLALPHGRPVRRGLVISHGYGGRDSPDTLPLLPDAAMIFPCARGLSLSRQPGLPDVSTSHVLHGIESRETYIHRGCAADIWAAATALVTLVPAAAARLDYVGTSFGGGIGALALPWDDRFSGAFLGLPSFGQHPRRLQRPSLGSSESVRQYAQTRPAVRDVLRYFDASVAARHLRMPTLVAAALADPMVLPAGQFAVYNGLPGPKELFVLTAGHCDWSGAAEEDSRLRTTLISFLSRFTL